MAAGGVFGPTDQVFYLFILGCVPIFKAGFLLLLPGRGAIGLTLPVFHAVPVDESKREREKERHGVGIVFCMSHLWMTCKREEIYRV